MKPTELRLGNLVYGINRRGEVHIPNTTPLKIYQIGIFNSECLPLDKKPEQEEYWLKITNSDLSPIPLTEEWLLKFGFGIDGEFDDHYIDNVSLKNEVIRYATDSNYLTIELYGGQVFEIPNIKYVHQLQNLYFALTNQELTIAQNKEDGK